MTEGVQIQQPTPPTGPFSWWKKGVIGFLGLSAGLGIFWLLQHHGSEGPGGAVKKSASGIAILPGNIRVPACDIKYEGRMADTPNGRYICTFTPEGGHMWRPLTPAGDLAPKPPVTHQPNGQQGAGRTSGSASLPGQTAAQARRDAIAEQRAQKLIAAAFSGSLVSRSEQPPNASSISAVLPQPTAQPAAPAGLPSSAAPEAVASPSAPLDFNRSQPLYWLPEGTLFDAVTENKLDGSSSGRFSAVITTNKYYPGTRILLIPQGAEAIGEVGRVSAFGQDRLAITFHRILVYPSLQTGTAEPYSVPLERQPPGQSQDGSTGLSGKVNTHWLSTFGSAAAVGGITGLSELGSFNGGYSPASGFYMGLSNSASQATELVLSKYLNRMPTVTVPPGSRVKIMLVADQQFPRVPEAQVASR